MQWHGRNDNLARIVRQMAQQLLRNHDGADAVMSGRVGNARGAIRVRATVKVKGDCASPTPTRPQKFQLLPAGEAERTARCGNRAATGAAFGQYPIQHHVENVAALCHIGLVGQRLGLHKGANEQSTEPPGNF